MNKLTLEVQNSKGLFMAVHVLQSYPANNLNRGEDGASKSCVFGGVRRSRISSQCVKRNARMAMYDVISENDNNGMGIRTKHMPKMIAGILLDWADDAKNVTCVDDPMEKEKYSIAAKDFDISDVSHALAAVEMQIDTKKSNTLKSLYYTSEKQCEMFAKAMIDLGSKRSSKDKDGNAKFVSYDEKEEVPVLDEALNSNIALDILMFGRMHAGRPSHNVEACIQVAHEVSAHRTEEEYDYFAAVDDLKSAVGEQGSAHLDTAPFTSSTMYRFCDVDLGAMYRAMKRNGSEMNIATLAAEWVRAFALSNPTGKQNSFAAATTPVYLYVSFHDDAPVSYANAFEKPISHGNVGYEVAAIQAFEERVRKSEAVAWRHAPIAELIASEENSTLENATQTSFPDLLENVKKTVADAIGNMSKERA